MTDDLLYQAAQRKMGQPTPAPSTGTGPPKVEEKPEPQAPVDKKEEQLKAALRVATADELSPEGKAIQLKIDKATAKDKADIAEEEARETKAKKDKDDAEQSLETQKKLTPEQEGQLVGEGITHFMKMGLSRERATYMMLRGVEERFDVKAPAGSPPPAPVSTTENKLVKDFLDLVLDEWKKGRAQLIRPRVEGGDTPPPPPDPLAEMERLETLGERYVVARTGKTTAEIAGMKNTPQGNAGIPNAGGSLDREFALRRFDDERYQARIIFEDERKAFYAKQDREAKQADKSAETWAKVGQAAQGLMNAGARAVDKQRALAAKEEIEAVAAATGQNPKCECGGEITAAGAPEGALMCQKCERSYPIA